MQRLLQNTGALTDTAESGQEAIAKLKTRTYDMVICDVELGNLINGFAVFEKVKEMGSTRTAFILSTGNILSAKTGANQANLTYLAKPFDRNDFFSTIKEALIKLPG